MAFSGMKMIMTTQTSDPNAFFFIQMSDPQLGMITANKDFVKEIELTTQAIEIVNRLAPEFIMLTGDMVNEPGDLIQIEESLRLLSRIEPRYYLLPGNHDIGDSPTPELLAEYRRSFGPDWYSFDVHGRHFIVLNSCLMYRDDQAREDHQRQWDWLAGDLRRHRGETYPPIVFMHHPFFLHDRREPDQYFNIPLAVRQKYLEIFDEYGIRTIMAGHLHQNNIAEDDGLTVITTGPVGLSLGSEPSGLRIFYIDGDRIRHRYYGLEQPPRRLEDMLK
jgi:serine/threonine-protein phosphatase CPPED1